MCLFWLFLLIVITGALVAYATQHGPSGFYSKRRKEE